MGRAEVGDIEIEPPLDLPIGLLGKTDRPRLGDALQPRGDIDAVAHQVAVALLDHVAEMDADPKFDAFVRRDLSIALDHRPLDFNSAVHRVDDTPELDNCAIAGALDDPAVVHGDDRVDQVAAERPQPRQNPVLVGSGQPRIADHVGHQDRGQFSGLAHGASHRRARSIAAAAHARSQFEFLLYSLSMVRFHAALGDDVEAESASLRVDRPVYPRPVDYSTLTKGEIENGAVACVTRCPTAASRKMTSL